MRTLDDYLQPVQETYKLPKAGLKDRMAAAGFRRIKRLDLKTVSIDLHVSDSHPAVSIFTWESAQGIDKALASGAELTNVKLTMKQQNTVIFYVLEGYEVMNARPQAA